jgi:hypothetical protein
LKLPEAEKRETITLAFTWPEKEKYFPYIYDVIVKQKKENAPLFPTFVFTCIHILYLHTRAGLGLRALCMCCGLRV